MVSLTRCLRAFAAVYSVLSQRARPCASPLRGSRTVWFAYKPSVSAKGEEERWLFERYWYTWIIRIKYKRVCAKNTLN